MEKAAPSAPWDFFIGLCTHTAGATGKKVWNEEGREKSGWHNKYPPLGNALKRKFCFTLWSLFLLALTSSGTTLKKAKVFMEKSPLQTWCLKSRRVAQTRDPGHSWGEGQLVLILNNSLKFYVSPMVFFVSVQKVPHSPQKRDLEKKKPLSFQKCYWFLNIFWQACCY